MFTNTGSNQLIYLLGYLFIYVFLVVEHLRQDNSEHVTQSKGNFFAVIPSRSFCQMIAIASPEFKYKSLYLSSEKKK